MHVEEEYMQLREKVLCGNVKIELLLHVGAKAISGLNYDACLI